MNETATVTLLDPLYTFKYFLDGTTMPLPIPYTVDGTGKNTIVMRAEEIDQWLGLYDENGIPLMTTVWGMGVAGGDITYPGPTIIAESGTSTSIIWQNKLPYSAYPLPFDGSIHGVDHALIEQRLKPMVMHLHGGHSDAIYDGTPNQWYTQGMEAVGGSFSGQKFIYDNDQDGALLWYHDHVLGMTRTNVYMGLAGGYALRDDTMDALQSAKKNEIPVLPATAFEVPLIIQDRAFTSDGQLYMPAYASDPLPGVFHEDGTPVTVGEEFPGITDDAPSIVPEFFGDHILVNGAAWPSLEVTAGDYMFDLLNGSDSRFYVLRLDNADVEAHLVGSDGGLLPQAITVMDGDGTSEAWEQIVLAPGERVQLAVDFETLEVGDSVRLLNAGPDFSPFKGYSEEGKWGLEEAEAATAADPVGNVMEFTIVAPKAKQTVSDASVENGTILNAAYRPIDTTDAVLRKVGLYEGEAKPIDGVTEGRVMPLLGTADDSVPDGFQMLPYMAPPTEVVQLGDTEVWQIHNFSEDAHPVHLHLIQFQVLSRSEMRIDEDAWMNGVPFDENANGMVYGDEITFTDTEVFYGDDAARNLYKEDEGWQDTVWVEPGQMVEIAATFDKAGEYVWHCHILSHEDHDMMRPLIVEHPMMAADMMIA